MRWATHPRFPDYIISENCAVIRTIDTRRSKAGTLLTGRVLKEKGRRQFKLVNAAGDKELIYAARLLAETFLGPAPTPTHQAAHNDGDRLNDTVSNIRWATPKENNADKVAHGTRQAGERCGMARLTQTEVAAIRAEYDGSVGSKTRLAQKYGVGRSTICRVLAGRGWDMVAFPPGFRNIVRRPISDELYAAIAADLQNEKKNAEGKRLRPGSWKALADKYGCELATIKNVQLGRRAIDQRRQA
jgi:hypothetical protein